jgi:hypothetical protein
LEIAETTVDEPRELCGRVTRKPPWPTPETLAFLREVEYRFHVRAFGEEMARVNFMPLEQRKQYLYDILDHARSKGFESDEPAGDSVP